MRGIQDRIRRWCSPRSKKIVLIYNMGKVGSTAIESGFEGAIHTHTLYGYPPCSEYHKQKFGVFGFWLRRVTVYPIKRFFLKRHKEINIITFYRDPYDRNLSMFMQDLPFWLSRYVCKHSNSSREEGVDVLVRAYAEAFPHDYPQLWVEKELCRFTGMDSETLSIGTDNYRILRKGKISVFIGRSEKMADCILPLVEHFDLSKNNIYQNQNRGSSKWYAHSYALLKQELSSREKSECCELYRVRNGY